MHQKTVKDMIPRNTTSEFPPLARWRCLRRQVDHFVKSISSVTGFPSSWMAVPATLEVSLPEACLPKACQPKASLLKVCLPKAFPMAELS